MSPNAYLEMANIEYSHWWFFGRRVITSSVIDTLPLKNNIKILEVGCGTGGNLKMLESYGVVSAFEMDEVALEIAKQKAVDESNIKLGFCPDDIPFKGERFDLICMFDVLEHIPNDSETLVMLKNYLTPDGLLLITVPAYPWLYGPHDVFLHHKRRYTSDSLLRLINSSGFRAMRVSHFNTILFPLVVLLRLRDKFLKINTVSGSAIPSRTINTILKYIFSWEHHLLRTFNLPFGVSILGVFQLKK